MIKNADEQVEIIEYLKTPLTEEELRVLVEKLGLPVEYLVRKNERLFKENYKDKEIEEDEWFKILAENPILIERPIVVKGEEAVLGRPPENVNKLIG